jgi:hypothetical protein
MIEEYSSADKNNLPELGGHRSRLLGEIFE